MTRRHVVLVCGPRGVGKTTLCTRLAAHLTTHGLVIDGVLTEEGAGEGGAALQTAVDLGTGERRRLAVAGASVATHRRGPVLDTEAAGIPAPALTWGFDDEGLLLGHRVMERCLREQVDAVVIDQIGPLEVLRGKGWVEALHVARDGRQLLTIVVVNEFVVDAVAESLDDVDPVIVRVSEGVRDTLPSLLAGLLARAPSRVGGERTFRILAADLDGTLLDASAPAAVPVKGVRAALARARAAGVEIVPCTGRPVVRTLVATARLGLEHGVVVCFQGAVIADVADGRWLERWDIPGETAAEVVRRVDGRASAYVDDEIWEQRGIDRDEGQGGGVAAVRVVDDLATAIRGVPVTRLVVDPGSNDASECAQHLAATDPGLRTGVAPGERVVVHHATVTKLGALRRVCETRSVRDVEVVAIGDDLDDVAMIAWAGLGICVRGAHPAALAAADIVAPQITLPALIEAIAGASVERA